MAFRVYVTVTINGQEEFLEQVLGNNTDFPKDLKEKYGLPIDYEDTYEHKMLIADFINLFTENFSRDVSQWDDETVLKVIEQYKDPKSMANLIPSWTKIGNFAIIIDKLRKFAYKDNVELLIQAG